MFEQYLRVPDCYCAYEYRSEKQLSLKRNNLQIISFRRETLFRREANQS